MEALVVDASAVDIECGHVCNDGRARLDLGHLAKILSVRVLDEQQINEVQAIDRAEVLEFVTGVADKVAFARNLP